MTPRLAGGDENAPRRPFWAAVHQVGRRKPKRTPLTRPVPPPPVRAPVEEAGVVPRKKTPPRTPANLAARIVARSNRERPADQELRESLRNAEGLRPGDARWVSRAVFAYFRWQAWLDDSKPLEQRLDQAIGFADTYARHPQRFPDDDLADGALPDWVRELMDVPVGWVRALQSEPRLWLRARPGTGVLLAEKLGGDGDRPPGSASGFSGVLWSRGSVSNAGIPRGRI